MQGFGNDGASETFGKKGGEMRRTKDFTVAAFAGTGFPKLCGRPVEQSLTPPLGGRSPEPNPVTQ